MLLSGNNIPEDNVQTIEDLDRVFSKTGISVASGEELFRAFLTLTRLWAVGETGGQTQAELRGRIHQEVLHRLELLDEHKPPKVRK
jgi:hypothetical protein